VSKNALFIRWWRQLGVGAPARSILMYLTFTWILRVVLFRLEAPALGALIAMDDMCGVFAGAKDRPEKKPLYGDAYQHFSRLKLTYP
jgi:hypothetical protein